MGTKPKKSSKAWPRILRLYDVVTWEKCPLHQMGAAPWSWPAPKALVKNREKWFHSRLAKRAAREHAVWNGKLVKSRSRTGKKASEVADTMAM
jgi:hypothetical protein